MPDRDDGITDAASPPPRPVGDDSDDTSRGVTLPRWGIVLGVIVVLVVGGVGVALVVADDDSDTTSSVATQKGTSTSSEQSAPTTSASGARESTAPGGGSGNGGSGVAPPASTTPTPTSTTTPRSPVTGLAPVVSETGHHFGMVKVGATSGYWPIVISNPNTVPLEIGVAGGAADDPFDGNAGTCGGNTLVLPPDGSCMMSYTFVPTAVGSVADSTSIEVTVVANEYVAALHDLACGHRTQ